MNLYKGINLLSASQKRVITRERYNYITKNASFVIVSLLVIITLSLYFSQMLLVGQSENLQQQIDDELALKGDSRITTINDATNELNATIASVSVIQANYIQWTSFFVTFADLVPPGIRINSLNIDTDDLSATLSGTATTRETYQAFLAALETSTLFTSVNSPISNLIQKENISFTITAQLADELYE